MYDWRRFEPDLYYLITSLSWKSAYINHFFVYRMSSILDHLIKDCCWPYGLWKYAKMFAYDVVYCHMTRYYLTVINKVTVTNKLQKFLWSIELTFGFSLDSKPGFWIEYCQQKYPQVLKSLRSVSNPSCVFYVYIPASCCAVM